MATELPQLIEKNSIDFFSSVPTHFEALDGIFSGNTVSNRNVEIHCASSPLNKNTYHKALKMFPNSHFKYHYGMTEMGSWITQKELGQSHEQLKMNDVGRVFGLSLKINSSDSHIYIKNEGEDLVTHDLINNQTIKVASGDYFDTKDVGHIEGENLFLDGRSGDFINKAGNKISALEIEMCIETICIDRKYLIIPSQSEFYGEEIAVVFFDAPATDKLQEEIQSFCLKRLGSLKVPKKFFFISEMPLTANGKVSRAQVLRLIERQSKKL